MFVVLAQSIMPRVENTSGNVTNQLGAYLIVCFLIVASCIVFRIVARRMLPSGIKADDWVFFTGGVMAEGVIIIAILGGIHVEEPQTAQI